jgi:hypothetical protein
MANAVTPSDSPTTRLRRSVNPLTAWKARNRASRRWNGQPDSQVRSTG